MKKFEKVDVVLCGLGAAGGIAAHVLTEAGLRVVALEVGKEESSKDFVRELDELAHPSMLNRMGEALINRTVPTWRLNANSATAEIARPILTMNGVGGSSVHFGGVSWRMCPEDFRLRSSTLERYGESALPEGAAIADWPVTYDQLEPYYDKVEYAIGVSGETGPFDGPRSRPFPMPPLRQKGWGIRAQKHLKELGYRPFRHPTAINSVPYGGRAACSYCGYCSGYGCWNDSKGSTLVTTIPLAKRTGKLEIRTKARVTRILLDDSGRANGVRYLDGDGTECEQPGGVVILGMFVYENVRRLLLSTSERFPKGLANNAGQVGKYYMTHTYVIVNGQYDGTDVKAFTGAGAQGVVIEDFYGDNFDHKGLNFIRGANIATFSEVRPIAAAMMRPPHVPGWGPKFKEWLSAGPKSICGIYAQMEVLPYHANFLDLDPAKRDDRGEPCLRVTYDLYDNEKNMATFLEEKVNAIHRKMGASHIWTILRAPPTPVFSHVFGGTRMGPDPATSVVNEYGFAHEVPNLLLLGGSVFPNTSGRNPTETMQALSWRSAEYLARNFKRLAA